MSDTAPDGRWDLQVRPEPHGVLLYLGRGWVAVAIVATAVVVVPAIVVLVTLAVLR